jgi:hypothetical protein
MAGKKQILSVTYLEDIDIDGRLTLIRLPITVAELSKAWTTFARLNAGLVGSNPTQGMDVCVRLFCVCAVLCVASGLEKGSSPVQRVLQTVFRIMKLKKRPGPNKGL